MIRIEHHGSGEFELKFDETEEFSEGQATTTGIGRGAITGAFVGGLAGAIVGAAAGALARKLFGRESWTTETLTGEFQHFCILRVAEDNEADLKPGEYRIEVSSSAQWNCEFIQPDVGQAVGKLTDDHEKETEKELEEAGLHIFTSLSASGRPTLAGIEHKGAGEFVARAFSVDGTHACTIHSETGQFYVEEIPTEIRPGKEYILMVGANGPWNINFTEAY